MTAVASETVKQITEQRSNLRLVESRPVVSTVLYVGGKLAFWIGAFGQSEAVGGMYNQLIYLRDGHLSTRAYIINAIDETLSSQRNFIRFALIAVSSTYDFVTI